MLRFTIALFAVLVAGSALAQSGTAPGSRPVPGETASLVKRGQILRTGAQVDAKCALDYGSVPLAACIPASGSILTPDAGIGQMQYVENNAAFTIAAPATAFSGDIILLIFNGASAGAVTFSGFSPAICGGGVSLDTTSGHYFTISIWAFAPGGVPAVASCDIIADQ